MRHDVFADRRRMPEIGGDRRVAFLQGRYDIDEVRLLETHDIDPLGITRPEVILNQAYAVARQHELSI